MIDLDDTESVITAVKTQHQAAQQLLRAIVALQLLLVLSFVALTVYSWGTFWAGANVTIALIQLVGLIRNFGALLKLQESGANLDRIILRWRLAKHPPKPPRGPSGVSRP